jgi:uncharacterized delta-60 repeat protein
LGYTPNSIALDSSGRLYLAGDTSSSGVKRLTRLTTAGAVDSTYAVAAGFNDGVNKITLDNNNLVIAVGEFTTFNGATANRIARVTATGALDTTFATGTGLNAIAHTVLYTSSGTYVGGRFSTYNGTSCPALIRLTATGARDAAFAPSAGTFSPNYVYAVAVDSSGKVYVGGTFSKGIVRLTSTGAVDSAFNVGSGFDSDVNEIAIDGNGKILVGGKFNTYKGKPVDRLIRLNPDGTLAE